MPTASLVSPFELVSSATSLVFAFFQNSIFIVFCTDYYSNDSHNLALYINNKRGRTEKAQLFMVTALYKNLKPFYTWGDSISKKKIQNNYVSLPVDSNKNLDFDTMEQLITIQEKLAIKNVVKWKDKIINTSKKCI